MTAVIGSHAKHNSRRMLLSRAGLAALAAVLVMLALPGLLAPWFDLAQPGIAAAERWHTAQWGALLGLQAGALAALAWRPRQYELLLQYLLLLAAGALACVAPFAPARLPLLLTPALLAAAAGPLARALRLGNHGPISVPLLALSLGTALLLATDARANLLHQLAANSAAAYGTGGQALLLDIALVLAGLLAATRRSGAIWLAGLAGAALIYLGLAAVLLAGATGGWGTSTSLLASALGWALGGAAYGEWRRAHSFV